MQKTIFVDPDESEHISLILTRLGIRFSVHDTMFPDTKEIEVIGRRAVDYLRALSMVDWKNFHSQVTS